ncbi:calcium/calmodulin-dependent protein kinase type 1B [Colletotrichum higginsianum]|uniref:Calcium/calmodulin-dependent protein kinase type 1B n=1 Tax=Colletotrichum higginsianum (strain IMI 349063) TaxID=759273 RepID=H1W4K5_COLHI|nr:Calcium/calmodulin-dependent protein kinase type 1B [Colletotrichum higginsianum IMI 349063]OBR05735.1 Calcium/calmodulin-dependent protein kinase type 1B [Colletotrichum higginsianum IMI 349063]CCF47418.1 calcium/calmodulin-dependent protein kinase type 1B [Colletotrichum higginsianum]
MSLHSDLVQESKLETTFFPSHTRHTFYQRGTTGRERRLKVEEQWTRKKRLGQGAYGTVWLETCDRPARQSVPAVRAVKEIPIDAAKSDKVEYLQELEAIMKFSQSRYTPCFVQSFGWFEGPESIYITMEYIAKGDLQQHLRHPIPERETKMVAFQLAEGLEHMHTNGFTHRDLKPGNILVVCGSPNWLVQISDFGISKRLRSDQSTLGTIRKGTLGFMAPEMLGFVKDRGYPHAVDIWSLGAVVYRMLTNGSLLADFSQLHKYALGEASLPTEDLDSCGATPSLRDLLNQLLAPSPRTRPSATHVLEHEWFKNDIGTSLEDTVETGGDDDLAGKLQLDALGFRHEAPDSTDETGDSYSAAWSTVVLSETTTRPLEGKTVNKPAAETAEGIVSSGTVEGPDENALDAVSNENTIPVQPHIPLTTTRCTTAEAQTSEIHVEQGYSASHVESQKVELDTVVIPIPMGDRDDVPPSRTLPWTPLHTASKYGQIERVRRFVEEGADFTLAISSGSTPLSLASSNGHPDVVKLLLDKGASCNVVNNSGWTPLCAALSGGHCEVAKLLILNGADVTAAISDGGTPLHVAVSNGYPDVVKLLLERGADPNAATNEGWTALSWASDRGNVDLVKLLLDWGANSNASVTANISTPLHIAVSAGHLEVVRLLLAKGADCNITTGSGWTPLHSAVKYGQTKSAELLLEYGADVARADKLGWTPLLGAADGGNLSIAILLLSKGANTAATTADGWTALGFASARGDFGLVKLLLERGADPKVASAGLTPLGLATNNGHELVAKLLRDKMSLNSFFPRVGNSRRTFRLRNKGFTTVTFSKTK